MRIIHTKAYYVLGSAVLTLCIITNILFNYLLIIPLFTDKNTEVHRGEDPEQLEATRERNPV